MNARGRLAVDLLVDRDLLWDSGSLGVVTHRGSRLWVALRLAYIVAVKLCLKD